MSFLGIQPIYHVRASKPVLPGHPLYVGNFYRDVQRVHRKVMDERQSLILFLARIHQDAVKSGMPLAFCRISISLTQLRKWVYDYRRVFDYFFDVAETGYRINEEKREITVVIPKPIPKMREIAKQKILYDVPPLPNEGVVSKVFIQFQNADEIRRKLQETNRFDLMAPVDWLLSRPIPELNVWFSPSGKLQLRDTSTWPIKALETWPSWLRVLLFGEGVDIESAYTQYLLKTVRESYIGKEHLFQMLFPELIRSFEDKTAWRNELCEDLGMEITEENISAVKRICMSLANGSRVSGNILVGNSGFSAVKTLLEEVMPNPSESQLFANGIRLSKIAKEYACARKIACMSETKKHPTRENQKEVFRTYFQWERDARYKIWEAIGNMGIMVHDGIDGIPPEFLEEAKRATEKMTIRIA